MARILHCVGYFDPAGDVTRSVKELNKYSKHYHDILVRWEYPNIWMEFPKSDGECRDAEYVNNAFDKADAIIYHFIGWKDGRGYKRESDKPKAFRNANIEYSATDSKFYCNLQFYANSNDVAYKLVGSCHLAARQFMGDRCRFLPALMPIEETMYKPATPDLYNVSDLCRDERDGGRKPPCIAFIKQAKDMVDLLPSGIRRLNLSNTSWPIVMAERRKWATITIDNVSEKHYGLAGTESLSQGIPSICALHEITKEQLKMIGGMQPFIEADTLKEAMIHAVTWSKEKKMAEEYGMRCREWIENYYHSKKLVEQFWEPFVDDLLK